MPAAQAGEDGTLPQAGATPPGEDASLSQVSTPLPPFPPTLPLLGKMPVFPRSVPPLPPFPPSLPLPGKMPVFLRSVHPLPPLPSQPTALLPSPEDRGPPNLPNTQAGQSNNPTTFLGKVAGNPQGTGPPASQEVHTTFREAITPSPPH